MWRFAKSVLLGTVAGGALPLIFTVPVATINLVSPMTGHRDFLASIYIAALPLLISFGFVFIASLFIGIPTSAFLRFRNAETAKTYQIIGGAVGLMLPLIGLLFAGATAGFWMCLLGAFAGTVTAQTWWRSGQPQGGG